jgi:Nucleotidyl transferase AbiEii toxin, Type IV TA system
MTVYALLNWAIAQGNIASAAIKSAVFNRLKIRGKAFLALLSLGGRRDMSTLSGPQVVGSAKVKVELWQAQAAALQSLQLKISTVTSPKGQAFVPTLTLDKIFADKVYALGARARIKPRDLFDLWWLCQKQAPQLTAQALHTRLEIYPVPSGVTQDTAAVWLANAAQRLRELTAPNAAKEVASDLQRWLPSSWPMN